jgi:hypothetical protein
MRAKMTLYSTVLPIDSTLSGLDTLIDHCLSTIAD